MPTLISPTQALLFLYEKCPDQRSAIQHWLTIGIDTAEALVAFDHFMTEQFQQKFIVCFSATFVNQDSVRRVFETQLALHVMKMEFNDFRSCDLFDYLTAVLTLLPREISDFIKELSITTIEKTASSEDIIKNDIYRMYSTVQNSPVNLLSILPNDKLELFLRIVSASFYLEAEANRTIFTEKDPYYAPPFTQPSRGRFMKPQPVKSHHLGILKSHTPYPYFGQFYNSTRSYRAPESSCYVPDSWADNIYHHRVHPFVNSISGFILLHIKARYFLQTRLSTNILHDEKFYKIYLSQYIAFLLLLRGGHSFYEFFAPFQEPRLLRYVPFKAACNITYWLQRRPCVIDNSVLETLPYHNTLYDREQYLAHIKKNNNSSDNCAHLMPLICKITAIFRLNESVESILFKIFQVTIRNTQERGESLKVSLYGRFFEELIHILIINKSDFLDQELPPDNAMTMLSLIKFACSFIEIGEAHEKPQLNYQPTNCNLCQLLSRWKKTIFLEDTLQGLHKIQRKIEWHYYIVHGGGPCSGKQTYDYLCGNHFKKN